MPDDAPPLPYADIAPILLEVIYDSLLIIYAARFEGRTEAEMNKALMECALKLKQRGPLETTLTFWKELKVRTVVCPASAGFALRQWNTPAILLSTPMASRRRASSSRLLWRFWSMR